jgi:hypothetical protein
MFGWAILVPVFSTIPALIPPFQVDIDGNVDDWIFSGFSLVKTNEIVLAPPLAGHRGGAWLSTPVVNKGFTYEVSLTLSCFASGGSFGIWLAAHFGADGEICGGPRSFRGVAVLGKVVVDENDTQYIQLTSIAADNDDIAAKSDSPPFAILPVPGSEMNLTIHVSSKDGRNYVVAARSSPKWAAKAEIDHPNPPRRFFIGVTAMNLRYFMKVALRAVRFSNTTAFNESDAVFASLNPDPHVDFPRSGRLQSHRFSLLEQEMDAMNESEIPESNFSHLLHVIDELNAAAYDVASFKELNRFLQQNLQPYAEKWQKRSIKVLLYTVFMSNSVSKLLERNRALFRQFNSSAEVITSRSKQNMEDLGQLVRDAADQSNAEYDYFVEEMVTHRLVEWLIIGGIVEAVLVIGLFVVLQIQERKRINRRKK